MVFRYTEFQSAIKFGYLVLTQLLQGVLATFRLKRPTAFTDALQNMEHFGKT